MPSRRSIHCAVSIALSMVMAAPAAFSDQGGATPASAAATSEPSKPPITQEELDQVLAPVALYPDSLISQILMASTYPLEVVQADRWVQANKDLKGDAQAAELEKQPWDPSVKSLVNFPTTLDMMNSKLDWTIKLGDAFIEQQTDVMNTIQSLRSKAQAAGNLTSNEQQTITVEAATPTQPQVIVIQPANPQVIYVPTYNPTIVYGPWWYPAYPPYYYYPPGYVYVPGRAAIWFGVGFTVGLAWGYAWGGCNWRGRSVNVNINRNININNTYINRNNYQNNYNRTNINGGQGNWKHDPSHRDGVAYRDRSTAQKYGSASSDSAQKARDQYRGRTDSGAGNQNRPAAGGRPAQQPAQRPAQPAQRPAQGAQQRPAPSGGRGGAFDGVDGGGGNARRDSQRGNASRDSSGGGRAGGGAGGGGGGAGRAGGGGGGGRGK